MPKTPEKPESREEAPTSPSNEVFSDASNHQNPYAMNPKLFEELMADAQQAGGYLGLKDSSPELGPTTEQQSSTGAKRPVISFFGALDGSEWEREKARIAKQNEKDEEALQKGVKEMMKILGSP